MSPTRYWYAEGQTRHGPVALDELAALLHRGAVHAQTLVWFEGAPDWQPLSQLEALRAALRGTPPPLPVPGSPAASASIGPDGVRTGCCAAASTGQRIVARWTEFWIWFVPGALMLGVVFSPDEPLLWEQSGGALAIALMLPFMLAAEASCIALLGNSPGKALVGIAICHEDGERLRRLAPAASRGLGVWVAGCAFGIPLVGHATMLWQAIRIARGHPTSYDAGRFRVCRRGASAARTALVLLGTLAALGFLLYAGTRG